MRADLRQKLARCRRAYAEAERLDREARRLTAECQSNNAARDAAAREMASALAALLEETDEVA